MTSSEVFVNESAQVTYFLHSGEKSSHIAYNYLKLFSSTCGCLRHILNLLIMGFGLSACGQHSDHTKTDLILITQKIKVKQ